MTPARTDNRTYQQTHPWIRFAIDLNSAPPPLWMALGEAKSKCQHLAGIPLKPLVAQTLHEVYLAKGALATTAIEGNTLNEKQALEIVQQKSELPKSQEYLKKEIENVLEASNEILGQAEKHGYLPITKEDIKSYNRLVLKNLDLPEYVEPGECVKTDVAVAGYHGAPWQECEFLLDRLCDWLNGPTFRDVNGDGLATGILKAIIAHLYLVWIHPFGDGNGRTARLLEVRFLTEAGVPSAAGHLLSNFYNHTRTEYYKKLDDASKTDKGVIEFIAYAVNGFVDELRTQLKFVKAQQWEVSWINYVYEAFEGRKRVADKRQLALVLALSKQTEEIPRSGIRRLTPELAEDYAGKTDKTIFRDLHALERRGLISRSRKGYRANNEQILAFLPRGRKGHVEAQIRDAVIPLIDDDQMNLDLPAPTI